MERRKIKELLAEEAILEVQDGNHGEKHPTASDYVEEGIPFVMARDFQDGQVDLRGACKIPRTLGDKLRTGFARTGDVLLTHKGSIGLVAIVPKVPDYVMLTPQVTYYRTNPKKLLNIYLKYSLQAPSFRNQLDSFSAQSTRPYIGITAQKELEIEVAPMPIQRRIAGVLSAYDELIQNSQRRIRILEAVTSALYSEWFVHFRFPGHESHSRAASPLGQIPKGWEVKHLSGVCSRMESGGTPKRKDPAYWANGRIDWFKTGELRDRFLFESEEKITELGQRKSNARLFAPGTILMAIYGSPTVGRLGIVTRPSSCNQAALGLVADTEQISQIFLYFVLLSLRAHFNGLAQGAAQQNISKEKVANAVALVPPRPLVAAFDRLAEPTFTQIQRLQRQIQNLRLTRDLLLPRLLSGQVEVEAA